MIEAFAIGPGQTDWFASAIFVTTSSSDMNNTTSYWCNKYQALIADAKARNTTTLEITYEEYLKYLPCMKDPVTSTSTEVLGGTIKQLHSLLIARTVLLMVTAIIGVMGNSAVIAFYVKRLRTLSPWKFLVFHLACCDFLFAGMQILLALPSLTNEVGNLYWRYGLALCKIVRVTETLGGIIAIQNILIIAVERYKGILAPLGQHIKAGKRVKVALFGAWMLALVSCVPILFVANINGDKNGACDEVFSKEKYKIAWSIYLLVIFGFVPFVLLGFMYGRIIMYLRTSSKKLGTIFQNLSDDQVRQRHNSDMQTIRMLVVVVVLFFLCIMPTRITSVIISLIDEGKLPLSEFSALLYCGYLTYPLHVAVNPVIYGFMDIEFRKALMSKCKDGATGETSSKRTGTTGSNLEDTSKYREEYRKLNA